MGIQLSSRVSPSYRLFTRRQPFLRMDCRSDRVLLLSLAQMVHAATASLVSVGSDRPSAALETARATVTLKLSAGTSRVDRNPPLFVY
jgi:hypothetical protein